MSKKLFILLALALVLSLALAACGGSRSEPTQAPAPTKAAEATQPAKAEEPTKAPEATKAEESAQPSTGEAIHITYWEQEGDDVDVFLDKLAQKFMDENPNITIERVHYANEDLRDQFQVASLAGEAPQLVRVPNDFAGPFSALDIIYPADKLFDDAFLGRFFDGSLEPAMVSGKLWGAPDNYGNHLMLLYNKEMVDSVPDNTDAWIEQMKGLTHDDVYGLAYNLNEPFWLAPWLGGFGGWPLDENDNPTLDSEAMVNALQFVHDLKFKDKVVPEEADYGTAESMFKEGKAAYFINGDWALGGYVEGENKLPFDFGVTAMPKVSQTGLWPSPMTSGKYWMVSNAVGMDSPEMDAVKKFIEFMTSDDVQNQWLTEFKRLPSSKNVAETAKAIKDDPILAGSMEQLSHGRGMPAAPQMRCAWDAMRPNLEAVMADQSTPADAAKAMQESADQCVKESGFESTAPAEKKEEAAAPICDPNLTASITYWEQENDEVDVFLDDLIKGFNEQCPNITVERVHYANEDLRDQFQVASLAGEAPQLVRVPNDFAGPFSALDIIYPADKLFDDAFLGRFFDGSLEPAMVSGKLWGAPDNYGNHLMLLYNKEMVDSVPDNTDAWIEQMKGLTHDDVYGLAYNLNEPFWLAPWLGGFGGWPLDENDNPTLDSEAMVNALQFVHDLKFKDKVVPEEADYGTAESMFKEGKAAYFINGDWALGGYVEGENKLPFDFGVTAMPKVSQTGLWPSPMTSGKYWMVSNQVEGDQLEAVKAFIRYMTSDEVQEQWLTKFKRLPSSQNVAETAKAIKDDPILAGSMEQLSHGRGMPAAPQMRCAWDAMRPNLEAVMADQSTPADAAKAMQESADTCVQEAGFNNQ